MYQSNTTKLYYVYYCIRATCFDSYRIIFRPFYENRSLLRNVKMRCGIPNAYILDITMYKMHVLLYSYCTIRILVSKTLKLVIYIVAKYNIYTEWPKKMYTLFIHQYLWNKFK